MGIEKLEPTVPRKDVDRRIQTLRKEQIRNTAQRFRFQMILQKYNTYQTHWLRICREIENGTYKRHLLKALNRFGDGRSRASVPPPAPEPAKVALAQPGRPSVSLESELAELDEEFAPMLELSDDDLQLEEERPAAGCEEGRPGLAQGRARGAPGAASRRWPDPHPAGCAIPRSGPAREAGGRRESQARSRPGPQACRRPCPDCAQGRCPSARPRSPDGERSA